MTITITARNPATGATRTVSRAAASRPLFTGQSTTGPGVALPQPSADDVVQDILATVATLLAKAAPGVDADTTATLLAEADRQARHNWGGERPYISKRLGDSISQRTHAIRAAYAQGMRVGAIARQLCCTTSQVERALGWK
jgi:hypothetical protein